MQAVGASLITRQWLTRRAVIEGAAPQAIDSARKRPIRGAMRTGSIARTTHETDIEVSVNLDGTGTVRVSAPASVSSTI
jgi:hypothetical protein